METTVASGVAAGSAAVNRSVNVGSASNVVSMMMRATSTASVIPQQEYLLQGSIMDSSCEVLLHRLRGLCDNADSPPETFHDHEMVFQIRGPTGTPHQVRVREALDHPEEPWHLRYLGQPEACDKNRAVLVRSCIDIGTSKNVVQFLNEMGFRLDFESVQKGYMFKKGKMKVLVSKLFRVFQGNLDSLEPVSQSYLVELSVVAPAGQDALAEEMKSFADHLKPLVQLEKIDPRRIQTLS